MSSSGPASSGPAGPRRGSDIAVSARGVGKCYRIAHNRDTPTSAGEALMRALTFQGRPEMETFWALKDVSFEVKRGEVVGLIGRNGAGKSTLLKVLSRITEPTTGEIDLYGRVGSLLEVGTGFHPELTGRENIFLNGAILGMKRREIQARFDEIVEFSGVGKFLDTPVKRYSSGMYVRLAFSVAAHLEPEILIVDEVLAVGDASFQQKCLGKMQDVASHGRTVLFVSHNMGAVQTLCTRAMLLDNGSMAAEGTVEDVIGDYLGADDIPPGEIVFDPKQASGYYRRVAVLNPGGRPGGEFSVDSPIRVVLEYTIEQPVPGIVVSFSVWRRQGGKVFFSPNYTGTRADGRPHAVGDFIAEVEIPGRFLAPGQYTITAAIHVPNVLSFDVHEHVLGFEVLETGSPHYSFAGSDIGSVLVDFPWKIRSAEEVYSTAR